MSAEPLVIEWAKKGHVIMSPSPFRPTEAEPYMVLSRCADRTLLDAIFCETCRVNLANVGQLEMHLEKGGVHRLALYCNKHRTYEEAEVPASLQVSALLTPVMTRRDLVDAAARAGANSPLHDLVKRHRLDTGAQEADIQSEVMTRLVGPAIAGQPRQMGAGMTDEYPELFLLHAINPNKGGQRSKAARGRSKAMGLLADLPDLHLPVMRGPFISFWLELKRPGHYGTAGQRRMAELLGAQGNCVVEVQSVEEAIMATILYLSLGKNRPSARAVCGPGSEPGTLDERIRLWRARAHALLMPDRKRAPRAHHQ